MIYLIDGYNLLFKLFHSEKKFEAQRDIIINYLQEKSSLLKLKICLVFDGYKQNKELSSILQYDKLKVVYTAKDQTADDYILQQILSSKMPQEITVVTSDGKLITKAKSMRAQIKSADVFIAWILKKENALKKPQDTKNDNERVDTKKNIQRLLKIFEGKLRDDIKE